MELLHSHACFSGVILVLLVTTLINHAPLTLCRSLIKALPGFPGPLPFHMETGYVGLGESGEKQFFYHFHESERNPREDPLLLLFSGGPGCSSWTPLAYGAGPIQIVTKKYDGNLPSLKLNPYSWTKVANIIYFDSPLWTGFSYSSVNYMNTDTKSAKDAHEFLRKWLHDHPQFVSNPLYIVSESYNGITAPILVQEIVHGIEARQEQILNLKGYILGSPKTDAQIDEDAVVPYIHGMGIISDELYESFQVDCNGNYHKPPRTPQCAKVIEAINECQSGIEIAQILCDKCPHASPRRKIQKVGHRRSLEENTTSLLPEALPKFGCWNYNLLLSYYYLNNEMVREALHIRKGTVPEWVRCKGDDLPYTIDVISSVRYHHDVLTTKPYRALIYSGDHDKTLPFIGTQNWIRTLNYSIVDVWRPWWLDDQVAGFTRTYENNLTFATVKGAGHVPIYFLPKESFAMFKRWISFEPL